MRFICASFIFLIIFIAAATTDAAAEEEYVGEFNIFEHFVAVTSKFVLVFICCVF